MNKTERTALFVAGLAGLFWALSNKVLAIPGAAWNLAQIRNLAQQTVSKHGFNVDPEMLVRMAKIESSWNPLAIRYEPLLNDASIGLMQTLLSTARWLAQDMGYTAYGVPDLKDLLEPEVSMYFGAAYVNWLRKWKGSPRDDKWVVMSYNGGPGADNPQTRNHWAKYIDAQLEIQKMGV